MRALLSASLIGFLAACSSEQATPPAGIAFLGGDGSSIEDAVVVLASSDAAGYNALPYWLARRYPDYLPRSVQKSEAKLYDAGRSDSHLRRIYAIFDFATSHGEQKRVYFDITCFYGRSEPQRIYLGGVDYFGESAPINSVQPAAARSAPNGG